MLRRGFANGIDQQPAFDSHGLMGCKQVEYAGIISPVVGIYFYARRAGDHYILLQRLSFGTGIRIQLYFANAFFHRAVILISCDMMNFIYRHRITIVIDRRRNFG